MNLMRVSFWALFFSWLCFSCQDTKSTISPADLQSIDVSSFADDELDLPYYVAHFHRLANAVVMEGEHRGFIDISVWRRDRDNEPYNARIMENILSLAFFYANDRPWNPYYGRPELRRRLEAALAFWCKIQSPEGKFSEYGPGEWNLAATAFATKFMGESLHWLEEGPPIDTSLLQEVIATDRKAIYHVLTDEDFYDFGRRYSNQYSNVWAGALAYLDLYPDEEIRSLLLDRIRQSMTDFQSTAGYFYEANGPDWSYNLGTHHSNLHMAFHYAKAPEIREMFAVKDRAFSEWLGYNSLPEPASDTFFLNRGVECRQARPSFEPYGWFLDQGMPLTTVDPLSHAFVLNQEEVDSIIENTRAELVKNWPRVDSLPIGEFSAFSPYAFLYRRHDRYYPNASEQQAATDQLPVHQSPFIHQRYDTRNETVYTFTRRPAYYAAFNSGRQVREQQRYGLGVVWTPETGAFLQSQSRQTAAAWGTRVHPDSLPYEAGDLSARFLQNGLPIQTRAGNRDLDSDDLLIRYELGDQGAKEIHFLPDRIQVTVNYSGSFFEHIPLVLPPGQEPALASGQIEIPSSDKSVRLVLPEAQKVEIEDTGERAGHKRVLVVSVSSENELTYEIRF